MKKRRILITGASGRIGSTFFQARKDRYTFTLVDRTPPPYPVDGEHRFACVELGQPAALDELLTDVEVVMHLAGNPDAGASFEDVLRSHILMTSYVLESVYQAGCRRFIYASSAQTIEGYPVDRQVMTGMPVKPANFYGVGKCYGEALCAYYASKGLSTLCVRIGAFEADPASALLTSRDLSAWLSPEDAVQLLERCVEVADVEHGIVHGISNNRFKRLDLTDTIELLDYHPSSNAFEGLMPFK